MISWKFLLLSYSVSVLWLQLDGTKVVTSVMALFMCLVHQQGQMEVWAQLRHWSDGPLYPCGSRTSALPHGLATRCPSEETRFLNWWPRLF